jgi:integrase
MAKPLTPIAVAKLRARPQRYEVADPGCQGLRVVVFPSKRKSFVVRFRFRGKQEKLTLGPCLTEHGVAETLTTRERREQAYAAEADTLQAICEEYLRRKEPGRTDNQLRADLELLYAPLGRQPVGQITRSQYVREFDRIADERGKVRRDRVLSSASRALNWHADREERFRNPLARMRRITSIRASARQRWLNDDELRQVWAAAEQDKGPFGPFVRFVLCTATRRSEAAGLRHSELSSDGQTWIIPAARYKSGKDTLIPLSKAAQRIIAAQPELGPFVFSATGDRGLTGFAERKAAFDKASGIGGYVIHDLRRTSRTLLSRAGISADIAERCLGHALVGVRQTYDRHSFEREKREAFEALAAQIERIVHPPAGNVADMEAERRKRRKRRK